MSIEAERAVIGQIANYPEHRATAVDLLKPEDFTGVREKIFAELKREIEAGADFESGDIDIAIGKRIPGAAQEFGLCYQTTVERITFRRQVDQVLAASTLRRVRGALEAAHRALAEAEAPATAKEARELALTATEAVALAVGAQPGAALRSQSEVLREFERVFEERKAGRQQDGVPSGLDAFDERTGGFCRGETYVVAAKPGVGKTAMMLRMLSGIYRAGKAALVESLEMSDQRLIERMYAAASGVSLSRLTNPATLTQADAPRLAKGYAELLPARVHYGSAPSVAAIRRDCVALRARGELDVLLVDYLGLIEPAATSGTRERQVADISRGLKLLAMELQIPVVVLSQLNRQSAEDEEPGLSELRDSGAVEQDASVVLMLWRGDGQVVNWKLAKNRNGELARGVFEFERVTQRINAFRVAETSGGQQQNRRAR